MKKSHKLYAAGGGLLVAAMMGFAPSLADDGVQEALQSDPAIEVAGATATENEFTVAGTETAPAEDQKTEAVDGVVAEEPAEQEAATEKAPTEESVESTDEKVAESVEGVENTEATEGENATEGTIEGTEGEAVEEETTPEEGTTPAEPEEEAQDATPEAQAPVEGEVTPAAPVEVVPVTYVVPRHSAIVTAAAPVAAPDPAAEAPLLTMAKTEDAPATTDNGDSQVVWFELPEPAGPALVPGQGTPLLNSAVSESAVVNANVVPATAVETAAVRPAQQTQITAGAQTVSESGNLSRSLARTGSVAQYASLLSAAAVIVGVALLGTAVVSSRRRTTSES